MRRESATPWSRRACIAAAAIAVASCGGEEDQAAVTAVSSSNHAPTITGSPPVTVVAGTRYSFTPAADDADGDALTFGADAAPGWLRLDPATGEVTGTPGTGDVGTFRGVTLWVSDGAATTLLPAFDLTVAPISRANNQPPVVSGTPDGTAIAGEFYDFVPTASDPDGDALTFAIANRPSWAAFDVATGRLGGSPDSGDIGIYQNVIINVTDGLASDALAPFVIVVNPPPSANTPPTISGSPPSSVLEGDAYSFRPTASDADGDTLSFVIGNQPAWTTFDSVTGELAGVPGPDDVGDYAAISIVVRDGTASTALPSFSITVEGLNSAPEISGTPPTTATSGNLYSFTPTASDADGDTLVFSVVNRPPWASFDANTGRLRGTPGSGDVGSYPGIRIDVSDGAETVSLAPFELTVVAANSPPVISGAPPTNATAGSAYAFLPSASDPDGDTLTFSISNRPTWATFDPASGELAGTPAAGDAGTYSGISISVSDGTDGDALPAFSITVSSGATNSPPTISGTPPTTVLQDTLYSFQPSAGDADGDSLTFGISNRPSWATFDTATGRLEGTPGAGDIGTYAGVVISVSDGTDGAALPAFGISVEPAATGSATLSWTPPTENTDGSPLDDLAGYSVYWGTSPGDYTASASIDNPGISTYVVDNLIPGTTYYFALKARNLAGVESSFSNEASAIVN